MVQQLRQARSPPDVEKRSSKVNAYVILKTDRTVWTLLGAEICKRNYRRRVMGEIAKKKHEYSKMHEKILTVHHSRRII
jgi:hypothetical protein